MNAEQFITVQRGLAIHLAMAGEAALARKYDTHAIKAERTYRRDALRVRRLEMRASVPKRSHLMAASWILETLAAW